MGIFNRAFVKAHAHRDCSFRIVGAAMRRDATRGEEEGLQRKRGEGEASTIFSSLFIPRSLRALLLFSISIGFFCNFFGVYRFTCASKIDDAYVACFACLAVYNRKAAGRVSVAAAAAR